MMQDEKAIKAQRDVTDSAHNRHRFLEGCHSIMATETAHRPDAGPERLAEVCCIAARHFVRAGALTAATAQRLVSEATGAHLDEHGNIPCYRGELWVPAQ